MVTRIFGVIAGIAILLYILLLRGLPVVFFIKAIPLLVLLFVAVALIYAGVTSD
jgi:hypothetical protein